ncbi:DUF418 domain-containing protein [Salipaludibacillus sp. LMS25]|jgi:uncharacterized protein|uniref:DUF418 domain-containing protein n=1 Tax=Salipaludibacillus sp. LMS25 TaxID=2924031 RepID=UPI0020D1230A|nr:DUF418 domain-containing protein [Salipaludibacillus sp. LMS25]UTR14027.1 DUF418 domain-containing protein [Salipaludibacillus sp. LMS25]
MFLKPKLVPTKVNERIVELDVLRGIALFGILVVNMKYFSTPALYLEMQGITWWDDPLNRLVDILVQLFFEFKFISIFSFLFGTGFALFLSQLKQKAVIIGPFVRRRLTFLLLVGFSHLFFIWYGDILTVYALLGFLLPLFIKKQQKAILILAFSFLLFPVFLFCIALFTGIGNSERLQILMAEMSNQAVFAYSEGVMTDIFVQRMIDIAVIYQGHLFIMPMVFGMFLLGVYAWESGMIKKAREYPLFMKRIRNSSVLIGLPFILISAWTGARIESVSSPHYIIHYAGHVISGPAFAIFYISSLFLFMQKDRWREKLLFFQPVGRMAFTNYLLQSFICTTLFYSYGLGLFGKVDKAAGLLLASVIFVFQLIVSHYWLRKKKMGPVEAIWRSFTYKV